MSYRVRLSGVCILTALCGGWFAVTSAQPPTSPVEEKIREALEGETAGRSSGDGLLDDVLGVIQERGSILDGSSLDPKTARQAAVGADDAFKGDVPQKARAAEQLLRASRLLEGLGADDTNRVQLVAKMRAEAVKLLTE